MTPAARLSAAIEIMADIEARKRPANDVIKDWGLSHRFAGSGDRAAIAVLVYDTLRRRASAAHITGSTKPRALVLGALRLRDGMDVDQIAALCTGERFAPEPLTDKERATLELPSLKGAPDPVIGDYPAWLDSAFSEAFGEGRVDELSAMTKRAPLDIRVNTLLSDRANALVELEHLGAQPSALSPVGIRIPPRADGRAVSVQAEPVFQKGMIEIQDEGSQLVALLAGAKQGQEVIDLCAGGGGKTLALAAQMHNHGTIIATDSDKRRLAPIFERLKRAGVTIADVRAPKGKDDEPLKGFEQQADLVLVDAPCSGTGTWRRHPDAKWRMRPVSLDDRIKDQALVLDRAARFVKPGGRIAYITCSLLPAENDGAVEAFLERTYDYYVVPAEQVAEQAGLPDLARFRSARGTGLLLSPKRCETDGFFIAILQHRS